MVRYSRMAPNDPDIFVDLATANTELEAEAMVSELAAHGVQAKVFSVSDATLRAFTQQAIRISVRRGDLDRSIAILKEFRSEPPAPDWSAVDTGDRSALTRAELAETTASGDRETGQTASRVTRWILAVAGICLVTATLFMIIWGLLR